MDKKMIDFEIRFYERIITERPNFVDALIPLAEAYTRKGFYDKGLAVDKRLAAICKKDPVVYYNLACSHALVGDAEACIKNLKKAIKLGYRDFQHMRKDTDLKALHGLDEFELLFGESDE